MVCGENFVNGIGNRSRDERMTVRGAHQTLEGEDSGQRRRSVLSSESTQSFGSGCLPARYNNPEETSVMPRTKPRKHGWRPSVYGRLNQRGRPEALQERG